MSVERLVLAPPMPTTPCHVWTGQIDAYGYGRFSEWRDGKRHWPKAHRVAFEEAVAAIPDGLDIDHLCRNRRCVNPEHMEPVTRRVNTLRGTGPSARNQFKTHCPASHPYDTENTYTHRGKRTCRTCNVVAVGRYRARLAGAPDVRP